MENNKVIIGRFGRTHGIRGWLKVISFTDPFDNIFHYKTWRVEHNGRWQTINIEDRKIHGNSLIVKMNECETPEQAREYTNDLIAINREELASLEEGEYYWTDLIGLRVVTVKGVNLGTIDSMLETGSNDVMVIKDDEHEHLLPYRNDIVKSVDLENKMMVVEWD